MPSNVWDEITYRQFQPTLDNGYDYLSMLDLIKLLIHVSKT